MRTAILSLAALAALGLHARAADDAKPRYDRRWVWAMSNLLVDKEADRIVALVERAGKDGYNGLALADYKTNFLQRMPEGYFRNVERVKAAASKAGVEIIPTLFPIGYSNGLLSNDVNLAEGMPVEAAPFLVKGREATLVRDPDAKLLNGDLEEVKGGQGDRFTGFGFQDEPGTLTFADREVAHHGKISCRMASKPDKVVRLIQSVKVRPHACYRFSCWARTRDLTSTGSFRLMANGAAEGSGQLSFHEGGLQPNMEWTRLEVAFNTQDQSKVNLYVGMWGGKSGTLWVDELELEELAMVNVLRRDGCPLSVTSDDGKTPYVEGKDFQPVRDPKLGMVPYEGNYDFNHEGAPLLLTPNSRIKDGETLRVGWYHPVIIIGEQVMCCLSEPKVYDLLRDQAERVNKLFKPKTFFMSHDEIRIANWCHACRSRKLTPGQLLADNARRCTKILKEINPDADVMTWSDMFDPNHNAVPGPFYLVNGPLTGSWEGLAPEVILANWNGGKAKASVDFFAKRGHRQLLAGYYDGDDNYQVWDAASQGAPRIFGFMYTTWQANYNDMARYGKMMRTGD